MACPKPARRAKKFLKRRRADQSANRRSGAGSARRSRHTPTTIANQIREANPIQTTAFVLVACHQITAPKAAKPILPQAAPAASSAAAPFASFSPRKPFLALRPRSCFSINVALAAKMAGKARHKPPITGPKWSATRPATTAVNPPKVNRTTYSYGLACFNIAKLSRTTIISPN